MIALATTFVLLALVHPRADWSVLPYLELTREGFTSGWVWQLVTYQFVHRELGHLLFNLLGIWMCGRMLGQYWDGRRCLTVFVLGGVLGGILQGACMWARRSDFGTAAVGASGGVCALLAAYATLAPRDEVRLLGLFPMRARTFFIAVVVLELLTWSLTWGNTRVAHPAHIGGFAAGILLVRWGQPLWDLNPLDSLAARRRRRTALMRAARLPTIIRREVEAELTADEFMRREVDPILDKISAHGLQSLTPHERHILERARERMARG